MPGSVKIDMAEAKAVRFGPIQQLNVYAHVDINFRCFHSPSMRSRLSEAFEVKRIAVYYIHILILKFLFLFLRIYFHFFFFFLFLKREKKNEGNMRIRNAQIS